MDHLAARPRPPGVTSRWVERGQGRSGPGEAADEHLLGDRRGVETIDSNDVAGHETTTA
jgi:hypothetical protein